jgi:hypothetical protein
MIRTYLTSASLFALALLLVPGCGKKNEETNTPGGAGDGEVDGTDGQGDTAGKPSKARGGTSTRGAGRPTKARATTVKTTKPARKPADAPQSINGMAFEAWSIDAADKLPDFSAFGSAEKRGAVEQLNVADQAAADGFLDTGLSTNFAARFNGSLNIAEAGEYELCLNSDDGAQLMLEGTLVVDNDGVKDGASEVCGLVYLESGEYLLDVLYFQSEGDRLALQFAWAKDGGDKALVPSEVLFKPDAR